MGAIKNVLVITKGAWRDDNNTGNTLNDIFRDFNGNVYSISCSGEPADDKFCRRRFVISEKDLISHIKNRKTEIGYEVKTTTDSVAAEKAAKTEDDFYRYYRLHKSHFKYLARDVLWAVSNWKNDRLNAFLDSIDVDAVFMVGYGQSYMYSLLEYVRKRTGAKVFLSFMDDYYTYKQFSFSPVFWIRRFYMRKFIDRAVSCASKLFAISGMQASEYERAFGRNFNILSKCDDFDVKPTLKTVNYPIKILYAGNIMCGRYKTLGSVSRAVNELNNDGVPVRMEIFSRNPLSNSIRNALNLSDYVTFGGAISAADANRKIKSADIVLHVESFSVSSRYDTRLSFSTKIVDYFKYAKCIFAVGWEKSASIKYLIDNDAALVVTDRKNIKNKLKSLVTEKESISYYANNAWRCGAENHKRENSKDTFKL